MAAEMKKLSRVRLVVVGRGHLRPHPLPRALARLVASRGVAFHPQDGDRDPPSWERQWLELTSHHKSWLRDLSTLIAYRRI